MTREEWIQQVAVPVWGRRKGRSMARVVAAAHSVLRVRTRDWANITVSAFNTADLTNGRQKVTFTVEL